MDNTAGSSTDNLHLRGGDRTFRDTKDWFRDGKIFADEMPSDFSAMA
jgi:hypothetical protein